MTIEATESSPNSDAETLAPASETPTSHSDASADSSPATGAKEPARPALLDVLRDVVKPASEQAEASPAPTAEKTETASEEGSKEPTDEELAKLPFHKHPRFQEVLTARNELRGKVQDLEARVRDAEGPAQQWGHVRKFMSDNALGDDDMLRGFRIMAMVQQNPLEGRKAIAEYLGQLDDALGLRLPADLRQDMDEGRISEERAFELSRSRASARSAEARVSALSSEQERQQTEARQTEARVVFANAARDWETTQRAKDPDFEAKQELIADRMRSLILAESLQPKNEAELRTILDRAHRDVTDHLVRFAPPARPINRPTTASNMQPAVAEPQSFKEAVRLAATR